MSGTSYFVLGMALGIAIGMVVCMFIYMAEDKSERRRRNKLIGEMRDRIRPFQIFAIQCILAGDMENLDKAYNDIHRIMSEYVDLY